MIKKTAKWSIWAQSPGCFGLLSIDIVNFYEQTEIDLRAVVLA